MVTQKPAFLSRMIQEQDQLKGRMSRLDKFIKTNEAFKNLDENRQTLLKKQYDAMSNYSDILQQRIDLENASLVDEEK